jgi:hypothetical protein
VSGDTDAQHIAAEMGLRAVLMHVKSWKRAMFRCSGEKGFPVVAAPHSLLHE